MTFCESSVSFRELLKAGSVDAAEQERWAPQPPQGEQTCRKDPVQSTPPNPTPAALPAKEAPEAEQQQEVEEEREHTPLGTEREDTWC